MQASRIIATLVTTAAVVGGAGIVYAQTQVQLDQTPNRYTSKDIESTGAMRAPQPHGRTVIIGVETQTVVPAETTGMSGPTGPSGDTAVAEAPVVTADATPPASNDTSSEPAPRADRN